MALRLNVTDTCIGLTHKTFLADQEGDILYLLGNGVPVLHDAAEVAGGPEGGVRQVAARRAVQPLQPDQIWLLIPARSAMLTLKLSLHVRSGGCFYLSSLSCQDKC